MFAAGFMLGAVRVFLIAPLWGELRAVLLEAPIMLLASWLACGVAVRRFGIRGRLAGLAMGGMSLALVTAAELELASLAFGRSPAQYLAGLTTAAGVVGLASRVGFGLFPLLRSGSSRRDSCCSG